VAAQYQKKELTRADNPDIELSAVIIVSDDTDK